MKDFQARLDWLTAEGDRMGRLTAGWASVGSGSGDAPGLERMRAALAETFGQLAPVEEIPLPGTDAAALRLRQRPDAPRQVLLVGHYDTVYGPEHPFQQILPPDPARPGVLRGPGVADMKGGLVVLWHALAALEGSAEAAGLGWEVILNPDEELGSPFSGALLSEAAGRHRLGLVFEPALPDGGLASARKGSGNFTVTAHGRAAHAGRDFAAGRNAVAGLAAFIVGADRLNGRREGVTVNVGAVGGGGAVNVVPDHAECRLNVRTVGAGDGAWVSGELERLLQQAPEGVRLEMSGGWTSPPKPADPRVDAMLQALAGCAAELGQAPLTWGPTGGTCDGNRLLAAGLPNVDNLGPRGGGLHSADEWIKLASLPERARLVALFLWKLATGRSDG